MISGETRLSVPLISGVVRWLNADNRSPAFCPSATGRCLAEQPLPLDAWLIDGTNEFFSFAPRFKGTK
jgi:hypothetical protein